MAGQPPFRDNELRDAAGESSFDAEARRNEAPEGMPAAPPCPFCEKTETEIMSAFGAHSSVSTYWCRGCRCPFDFMKWQDGLLR